MKLSPKAKEDIKATVVAFFVNDGEDQEEAEDIANQVIKDVKKNIFTFEFWDAMGCDDLELVSQSEELQTVMTKVNRLMAQSQRSIKH